MITFMQKRKTHTHTTRSHIRAMELQRKLSTSRTRTTDAFVCRHRCCWHFFIKSAAGVAVDASLSVLKRCSSTNKCICAITTIVNGHVFAWKSELAAYNKESTRAKSQHAITTKHDCHIHILHNITANFVYARSDTKCRWGDADDAYLHSAMANGSRQIHTHHAWYGRGWAATNYTVKSSTAKQLHNHPCLLLSSFAADTTCDNLKQKMMSIAGVQSIPRVHKTN